MKLSTFVLRLLCLSLCLLLLPLSACNPVANDPETESDTAAADGNEQTTQGVSAPTISITEQGGIATVTLGNGLSYTAQNYSALRGDAFVFNQDLEINFPSGTLAGEFNRIRLDYESTEPVRVVMYYTMDGAAAEDDFYLDAKQGSFVGLISTYLDGKKADSVQKLVFHTCRGVEGELKLTGVASETIPLYANDLCVENDRFKIGVRLNWGGAMTYFEDKQDGIARLGNMVNVHDAGRVIQQSFYGTKGNDAYTPSSYNGSKWPYNPVQAGNRFDSSRPRLINVEVTEDSIYILAQSLDWAFDGVLTYMYYENRYTLQSDAVRVDNVATDYSGWQHDPGSQEIPAVYLVSYFDTLCYYNGTKPWTNNTEGLQSVKNIGGWEAQAQCYFAIGNTETWAAWVNTDQNFAFGIYCPNVDKLIAIRHQFNGSTDPMSDSTTYVAPSSTITMQSYKPIAYSYLLTSGTPEQVREVFTAHKDFSTNASLSEDKTDQRVNLDKLDMTALDFTAQTTHTILSGKYNTETRYNADMGATEFVLLGEVDPYVTIDFAQNSDRVLQAGDYNTIEFEYMIPAENGRSSYTTVLFLCAGNVKSYTEECTVSIKLIKDGKYHKATLMLPDSKWSGEIHKIRFDFFHEGAVNDKMYLKSFKLVNTIEIGVENDLTVKGSEVVLASPNSTAITFDEGEGCVKIASVQDNGDVSVELLFSNLGIKAEDYKTIVIEYMLPKSNSTGGALLGFYLCAGADTGYSGAHYANVGVTADGEYHTVTVTLDGKEGWSGLIKKIRFDYFEGYHSAGDAIYIRSISLQ